MVVKIICNDNSFTPLLKIASFRNDNSLNFVSGSLLTKLSKNSFIVVSEGHTSRLISTWINSLDNSQFFEANKLANLSIVSDGSF